VVISGIDIDGTSVSETFTIADELYSVTGTQEFASVTSIVVSGLSGTYAGNTLQVGVGGNCQVKKGRGHFAGITVGATDSATALKIIDGTSGSTTNIGELKASIAEGFYEFGCLFNEGLRLIVGSSHKVTVMYR